MSTVGILVVALAILLFGVVSKRVSRTVVTPPMIFVLMGVLVGPLALDLFSFSLEASWIHLLAELTLVVILFTDATRIDLPSLVKEHNLPLRLLVVGLPLCILLGCLLAVGILPELHVWEALILAAILAPTDAALGQAVVSSPVVPGRVRQALNVESGLNDGLALPAVLVGIALVEAMGGGVDGAGWVRFTALQLVLGPLVGIAVGYLGGTIVLRASEAGWMSHTFQELSALGLSFLAFGLAEVVGGNGFIAAFFAGLAVGNFCRQICTCLHEFGEAEGQLLALVVFMVFGAAMVPVVVEHGTLMMMVYGLLSLTVVRGVATAIALVGSGVRPVTVAFLGWFGPRGIASVLFVLVLIEESMSEATEVILAVVATTVLLSVFAHGLTANPGARWYARSLEDGADADAAEHATVSEMPARLPGS